MPTNWRKRYRLVRWVNLRNGSFHEEELNLIDYDALSVLEALGKVQILSVSEGVVSLD